MTEQANPGLSNDQRAALFLTHAMMMGIQSALGGDGDIAATDIEACTGEPAGSIKDLVGAVISIRTLFTLLSSAADEACGYTPLDYGDLFRDAVYGSGFAPWVWARDRLVPEDEVPHTPTVGATEPEDDAWHLT
jgi:hypothetical protein